ncbi:MAG: 30S ribosomal protein S6 [Candidatus Shikimatogenerans sp. JK-2022]|nr:30S ribosomal protein S6 [Candidatus Shikimatogenerans bostrichidophilus]
MYKHYETIIILTPVLSEEQIKNVYIEYKLFLKKNKVNIIKKEKWGMKKLAYKIKNKSNGYFYLFEYECVPLFIKNINNKILQDERIIRYLTVKMNKHAIEYSKTRTLKNETKTK